MGQVPSVVQPALPQQHRLPAMARPLPMARLVFVAELLVFVPEPLTMILDLNGRRSGDGDRRSGRFGRQRERQGGRARGDS